MPASRGSGHFCRFVNILPTKFSKCLQKPRSLLRHFIGEVLVDVHGDLDIFVSKAMLHILGGSTQLRKHGGMGVSEIMEPNVLRADGFQNFIMRPSKGVRVIHGSGFG